LLITRRSGIQITANHSFIKVSDGMTAMAKKGGIDNEQAAQHGSGPGRARE